MSGMYINHNLASMSALSALSQNSFALNNVLQQLSTGKRINSAADDAAGLAISQKMQSNINGLDQASRNAQDGISLVQTADGALNETQSILQRMNQLAVQASNDSSTNADRSQIQKEVSQLKSEIDRIASTTQFNGKNLLDGSLSSATALQGTVENSNQVQVASTAATSGTETGGVSATMQSAVSATQGTGQSYTSGNVLASTINIASGVNDQFSFTVNNTTETATIAGSPQGGYTRQQFVQAVQSAINTVLQAQTKNGPGAQVTASLTSDNRLQLTSTETGSGTAVSVAQVAAGNGDALAAMGFDGAASGLTATGSVALTDTYVGTTKPSSAAEKSFQVDLNGVTKTISLSNPGVSDNTVANVVSDIQGSLDTQFGAGVMTAGTDSSGHLTIASNVSAINSLQVSAAAGDSFYTDYFGTASNPTTGSSIAANNNVTVKGTDTVEGVSAGTVISQGANDQFNISVDGGTAQTITLTAGNYGTTQSLVNEINNEIGSNSSLVGKAQASVDNSGKIVFTSASTGSSSSVALTDPTNAKQSALGALGYEGDAGAIQGASAKQVNISGGVALIATDEKFTVQLGQQTATIDLSQNSQIKSDITNTVRSSRDTIVEAFQQQLDTTFGKGAVTVSTTTSGANQYLVFTPNAQASRFSIANASTTGTGMHNLVDSSAAYTGTTTALSATVGSNPNDISVNGANGHANSLATSTSLTSLTDSNGNNLGIASGNVINVSGTQNGQAFSTSLTVGSNSTVGDLLNSLRNTSAFQGATVSLDTTNGDITVQGANGAAHDISNLQLTAQASSTDSTQVANFNRVFGSFNVSQQAQDSSQNHSLAMQIGAAAGQTMSIDIGSMNTQELKLGSVDVSTQQGASTAISVINNAISDVSSQRAKLGAFQNRLQHTINNLSVSSQNLTGAQSQITDVDMAASMAEFTKDNVLKQAATSMLAQANQLPQLVLKLLG